MNSLITIPQFIALTITPRGPPPDEPISTLNGGFLKLVDKFTYLGSSVPSTENKINMRLVKVWTAIDRLSIIWKFDQSNKTKRNFFQAAIVSVLYECTT